MFLYIDPGTGSMLFSIIIGVASTLLFFGKKIWLKFKFFVSGGKTKQLSDKKIPYVIYSDSKRYWNLFEPICRIFEEKCISLVYYTGSYDDPALSENYKHVRCEFIGEGNKGFAKLNMLNAGLVLSTTPGLNVYQWKKSKNVDCYIHVFHSITDGTGYRMFGLDFYDVILTPGPEVIRFLDILTQKRNLPHREILSMGLPYLDELKMRVSQTNRKNSGEITVLLAPSWGNSAILSRFGEKIIKALLNTPFNIIIRPHPQSMQSEKDIIEPLMNEFPDNSRLKWNFDNDNFNVLYESDILISDFSAVVYDYTLAFDKPFIYADTHYDPSCYDSMWMDDKKYLIKILPELGKELKEDDFPEMETIIKNSMDSSKYKEAREKYKSLLWCNEGKSAEMIADYMINKYNELCNKEI